MPTAKYALSIRFKRFPISAEVGVPTDKWVLKISQFLHLTHMLHELNFWFKSPATLTGRNKANDTMTLPGWNKGNMLLVMNITSVAIPDGSVLESSVVFLMLALDLAP